MARTKQTARKSTGGRAPRKILSKLQEQNNSTEDKFSLRKLNWNSILQEKLLQEITKCHSYEYVDRDIVGVDISDQKAFIVKTKDMNWKMDEKMTLERIGNVGSSLDPEQAKEFAEETICKVFTVQSESENNTWELGYLSINHNFCEHELVYLFNYGDEDRYLIVGVEGGHPYVICHDFNFGNSDGSGPGFSLTKSSTSNDLIQTLEKYLVEFCSNRYH